MHDAAAFCAAVCCLLRRGGRFVSGSIEGGACAPERMRSHLHAWLPFLSISLGSVWQLIGGHIGTAMARSRTSPAGLLIFIEEVESSGLAMRP